jgi:division/cell wall cluster transcriptional repressor MraZ
MKKFLGSEKMTVDEKGRVGIPARFMAVLRSLYPNHCATVGVTITPDLSIKLMPLPLYNEFMDRLDQFNDQIEEERLILNLVTSFAEEAELDKQNRIKLSQMIMEKCQIGIGRQVVVTGNQQYMQIFDEDVWREYSNRGLVKLGSAASMVARKEEARPAAAQGHGAGEEPASGAPGR